MEEVWDNRSGAPSVNVNFNKFENLFVIVSNSEL